MSTFFAATEMNKFSLRAVGATTVFLIVLLLAACGGGEMQRQTPEQTLEKAMKQFADKSAPDHASPKKAAPQAMGKEMTAAPANNPDLIGGVPYRESANQLMDAAEMYYPGLFPGKKVTQDAYGVVLYRYYPETGCFAGVAHHVQPGSWLSEGGAYTLGCIWGDNLTYIDQLVNLITPVMPDANKAYAMWDGGFPYVITKTTKVPVQNRTRFEGNFPFFSCGALPAGVKQDDGSILIRCRAWVDGQLYVVRLDPATDALYDFTGQVPSDAVFMAYEENSTQPVPGTTACHANGGWYYADSSTRLQVLFQADAGGTPVVVAIGTFADNGTVGVLRCY